MKLSEIFVKVFALTLLITSSHVNTYSQEKQIKKRIAVFSFKDETDGSHRWWNAKGVGVGMSDMLVTELVQSGKYRVLEREELASLINEQNLEAEGVVTPESAAQIGKALGVELAVIGSVTEFGYKDRGASGGLKGLGLGLRDQAAIVAVDCRLVNTTTGEILVAENVRKQSSSKGVKVRTKKARFDNRNGYNEALVGKAVRQAIEHVAAMVNSNEASVPWQAKVMTESSGQVYINAGSIDGIQPGDQFIIYSKGDDLIDPDTGLALGSIDTKIGVISVADPNIGNGKASQCSVVEGTGFKKGDFVRMN